MDAIEVVISCQDYLDFRTATNVPEIGMNIKGRCQNVIAIIRVMSKAS